jgi:hypothetical protein
MDPAPLTRPTHLQPAARPRSWLARQPAGVIAALVGLASFVIVVVAQHDLFTIPDPRRSVPGFALTALAAVVSIGRRERAWKLWLVGLGFATAALMLGWFLLLAIVLGALVAVSS